MRSKREILTTMLSAASLTALAAQQQPNVLVVITDEHNFRTIGAYRNQLPKEAAEMWGEGVVVDTPNLDYLASQGALCTNHYSPSPSSSPARSSLVSGMYPSSTGVMVNNLHMNDDIITFAETLKREGYTTGYAGKWHLDGEDKPGWSPKAKFGFDDNRYMFNRGHYKVLAEGTKGPYIPKSKNGKAINVTTANDKRYTTDWLTNHAVEYIERNYDRPFCYMLSIPDPHTPNTVRKPYDTQYIDQDFRNPKSSNVDQLNLPEWFKKLGHCSNGDRIISQTPAHIAAYWGMVKCIDDNMGKLIATLKAKGIFENTIIVFTSDHGDMLGEHYKDNKGIPQEGSAKVPFIFYYPGVIKAGSVVTYAMNHTDFTPTLLSLMCIESDVKYQGRDCSQLLVKNKAPKGWKNVTLSSYRDWIMATDGIHKLICLATREGIDITNTPVLFDLKSDPMEMNSVYDKREYKKVSEMLMNEIKSYHSTHWRAKQ